VYRVENLQAEIDIEQYIEEYINIEEFLECCRKCVNYEKKWSCPPFDFDVLEYWKKFKKLFIWGEKISFDWEAIEGKDQSEESQKIINEVLGKEKQQLSEKLFELEKSYEGSISLSAGSCGLCGNGMMDSQNCTRVSGCEGTAKENCVHFDKMRYSIEALGGNVGKTCTKLLGIDLEWIEENKLPTYFVLVCGLLKP